MKFDAKLRFDGSKSKSNRFEVKTQLEQVIWAKPNLFTQFLGFKTHPIKIWFSNTLKFNENDSSTSKSCNSNQKLKTIIHISHKHHSKAYQIIKKYSKLITQIMTIQNLIFTNFSTLFIPFSFQTQNSS